MPLSIECSCGGTDILNYHNNLIQCGDCGAMFKPSMFGDAKDSQVGWESVSDMSGYPAPEEMAPRVDATLDFIGVPSGTCVPDGTVPPSDRAYENFLADAKLLGLPRRTAYNNFNKFLDVSGHDKDLWRGDYSGVFAEFVEYLEMTGVIPSVSQLAQQIADRAQLKEAA